MEQLHQIIEQSANAPTENPRNGLFLGGRRLTPDEITPERLCAILLSFAQAPGFDLYPPVKDYEIHFVLCDPEKIEKFLKVAYHIGYDFEDNQRTFIGKVGHKFYDKIDKRININDIYLNLGHPEIDIIMKQRGLLEKKRYVTSLASILGSHQMIRDQFKLLYTKVLLQDLSTNSLSSKSAKDPYFFYDHLKSAFAPKGLKLLRIYNYLDKKMTLEEFQKTLNFYVEYDVNQQFIEQVISTYRQHGSTQASSFREWIEILNHDASQLTRKLGIYLGSAKSYMSPVLSTLHGIIRNRYSPLAYTFVPIHMQDMELLVDDEITIVYDELLGSTTDTRHNDFLMKCAMEHPKILSILHNKFASNLNLIDNEIREIYATQGIQIENKQEFRHKVLNNLAYDASAEYIRRLYVQQFPIVYKNDITATYITKFDSEPRYRLEALKLASLNKQVKESIIPDEKSIISLAHVGSPEFSHAQVIVFTCAINKNRLQVEGKAEMNAEVFRIILEYLGINIKEERAARALQAEKNAQMARAQDPFQQKLEQQDQRLEQLQRKQLCLYLGMSCIYHSKLLKCAVSIWQSS